MNRSLAIAIIAIIALGTSNVYLFSIIMQQSNSLQKPAQAPTLQKFKAYGLQKDWEGTFLIIDAGKDKGVWTKYGLDPEFVYKELGFPTVGKDLVDSGVSIGFAVSTDALLVRSQGVPIKIVAGQLGDATATKLYVRGDSPIRSVKDLDGMKIGLATASGYTYRYSALLSSKFGIRLDHVLVGNITNRIVALKLGKIDAFFAAEGAPLRLLDSGELRVLLRVSDLQPKPIVNNVVWATEHLMESDPDLVRRFVKATLETVNYLAENPSYAAEIYARRANAPRDLADKVVSQLIYSPSGQGEGGDLFAGVANHWQFNKDSGAVPANINVKIEDAVDVRFLP